MKKGNYVDEKLIRLQDFYQRRTSSYDLLTDEVPIRGKWCGLSRFHYLKER